MSKWYDGEPRRQEVRATEPRPRPQRARRNTRRWCRGKVGVEHVLAVRVGRHARNDPPCYRAEWWQSHWWCNHERYCVNCGKILTMDLGTECEYYSTEVTRRRSAP